MVLIDEMNISNIKITIVIIINEVSCKQFSLILVMIVNNFIEEHCVIWTDIRRKSLPLKVLMESQIMLHDIVE
jgi:hypothetical protein